MKYSHACEQRPTSGPVVDRWSMFIDHLCNKCSKWDLSRNCGRYRLVVVSSVLTVLEEFASTQIFNRFRNGQSDFSGGHRNSNDINLR